MSIEARLKKIEAMASLIPRPTEALFCEAATRMQDRRFGTWVAGFSDAELRAIAKADRERLPADDLILCICAGVELIKRHDPDHPLITKGLTELERGTELRRRFEALCQTPGYEGGFFESLRSDDVWPFLAAFVWRKTDEH